MDTKSFDINRRHPIYIKYLPIWNFYKDSYKGGRDYVKPYNTIDLRTGEGSYLYPHDNELNTHDGRTKFKNRHRKSFYPNYCRLPINTYTKYIFNNREQIKREYESKTVGNSLIGYDLYVDNINLQNDSINDVMKKATIMMLVYGITYLLVDKNPLPENIFSLEQQISINARGYCVNLDCFQVVDWSIDDITKQYNWVLIENDIRDDADPFKPIDEDQTKEYILWTKDTIYKFDGEKSLKEDPIPNTLGYVPLIRMVYSDMDLDDEPESLLTDMAKLNQEIYNAYSLYQEELYKLAFSQLMKQRSKDNIGNAIEDDSDTKQTEISVDNILNYPAETNPPEYLRFPVDALVEKRAYINDLILKILQMANLDKQDGIQGGNYLSGLAMAFSYNDTYYSVSELAQKIEGYEQQVWDILYDYDKGIIDGTIEVNYPDRYDIMSDNGRRENFLAVHENIESSPTAQVINDYLFTIETLRTDKKDSEKIWGEMEKYWEEKEQNDQANQEAMGLMFNNQTQNQNQEQDDNTNNQDFNPDEIDQNLNQEVTNGE